MAFSDERLRGGRVGLSHRRAILLADERSRKGDEVHRYLCGRRRSRLVQNVPPRSERGEGLMCCKGECLPQGVGLVALEALFSFFSTF